MATQLTEVYDAFLARITADEWTLEEELAIVERDWQELLKMAIFRFKYPRIDLSLEEKTFLESYKKRSFFLGNKINVIKNEISVPAQALDIDDNCRLLVEYQNGEREYLSSGEISIKL